MICVQPRGTGRRERPSPCAAAKGSGLLLRGWQRRHGRRRRQLIHAQGRSHGTAWRGHDRWGHRAVAVVGRERPGMPAGRIVAEILQLAAAADGLGADTFVFDARRSGTAEHRLGATETIGRDATRRNQQETWDQQESQRSGCGSRRHGCPSLDITGAFRWLSCLESCKRLTTHTQRPPTPGAPKPAGVW